MCFLNESVNALCNRTIESLRLSYALWMLIYQVLEFDTKVNTLHLGFIEFYSEKKTRQRPV